MKGLKAFSSATPDTIVKALDGVLCPGCSTPHGPLQTSNEFLWGHHDIKNRSMSRFIPASVPEGFTFATCLKRTVLDQICMRWIRTFRSKVSAKETFPMQPLVTLMCRRIELECFPLILSKRGISSLVLMVFHELANRMGDPSCFDGQFRFTQIRDNVMTAGLFNKGYERLIVAIRTSELDPSRYDQDIPLDGFAVVSKKVDRSVWSTGDTVKIPSPSSKTTLEDELKHSSVRFMRDQFLNNTPEDFAGLETTIDRVCSGILNSTTLDPPAAVRLELPTTEAPADAAFNAGVLPGLDDSLFDSKTADDHLSSLDMPVPGPLGDDSFVSTGDDLADLFSPQPTAEVPMGGGGGGGSGGALLLGESDNETLFGEYLESDEDVMDFGYNNANVDASLEDDFFNEQDVAAACILNSEHESVSHDVLHGSVQDILGSSCGADAETTFNEYGKRRMDDDGDRYKRPRLVTAAI
jgi:hypothetical protein